MRIVVSAIVLCFLAPLAAQAQQGKHYRWVDKDGVVHYGDSVPAEYSDLPKQVVNDHGVPLEELAGRKSDEEREAERVAEELAMQKELQRRADQTLIVTYQNVDEIEMHRDRRVELFQAQSRVTELYLRNQRRALEMMRREATQYRPYNSDPSAPMIDPQLVAEIKGTTCSNTRTKSNRSSPASRATYIASRF